MLVFGDSLSAGYGLAREQAWPALLAKRLADDPARRHYTVVNASISGETTAGGRSRLAAELERNHPRVLVIELGANDGLRGLPIGAMRDNLEAMVTLARSQKIQVLLIGMRLPPNYGPDYTQQFAQTFADVARKQGTALLPFLLEPIAAEPAAFQSDNLHPVASAQPRILDHVWSALRPLLKPR